LGAIDIDSDWSTGVNNFVFDTKKFPNPAQLVSYAHSKGFPSPLCLLTKPKGIKVILWVTSMVDTNSPNYQEGLQNDYYLNKGSTHFSYPPSSPIPLKKRTGSSRANANVLVFKKKNPVQSSSSLLPPTSSIPFTPPPYEFPPSYLSKGQRLSGGTVEAHLWITQTPLPWIGGTSRYVRQKRIDV
jgi:hypothetical protein